MAKQLSVCRECNAHKAAVFLCLFIFTGFFLQMLFNKRQRFGQAPTKAVI